MTQTHPGEHIADIAYTSSRLKVYDLVLHAISGPLWGCSVKRNVQLYDEHVSGNHLEVGPGTGYFLDRCRFPIPQPRLVLMDPNRDPLDYCARRLDRYKPAQHQGSVLEPISKSAIGGKVDSIGINHVLHCLPGTMREKGVAFQNLREIMNDGAVVFGATVLGHDVKHNWAGAMWLKRFNAMHVLDNLHDSRADLERVLQEHFSSSSVQVIGRTAIFTARK